MSLKVACGDIIGLYYDLAPKQVMSPCTKAMYYYSHLLLLNGVLPLDIIKILTLKGNEMTLLHQNTTNGEVRNIRV